MIKEYQEWACGLVVMTSALHAGDPRFKIAFWCCNIFSQILALKNNGNEKEEAMKVRAGPS